VLGRDIKEENIYLQAVEEEKTGLGFSLIWTFIGLLALITIITTVLDNKGYCTEEKTQQSPLLKLVSCFSLPRNINSFLKSSNVQDNNFGIFNGIRLILMAWFILSTTYTEEFLSPAYNRAERHHMMLNEFRFAFVKSGTMALDAFFMISGFFATSSLYLILTDKKARTPKTFLACYLYKYLRLLPITVFTILLMIFIVPSTKKFPLNPHVKTIPDTCSKSWHLTILYTGNFQGYDDICIDWSWFLMNDMQFYLLAPFLILPFLYSKFIGNIILLALGSISLIVTGVIYSSYNLHMSLGKDFNNDYYSAYYIRPYCRILPYLMGILLYMIYKDSQYDRSVLRKSNAFIEGAGKYLLCLVGLLIMFFAVISIYFIDKNSDSWNTGLATVHELFSRPLFVFGLMLVLYPSLIGHNKLLVYIFGHPILNPFGKLTYSVYMIHFIVLYLVLLYGQIGHFVTESFIFFNFFTIISVAYLLSFGIAMLIELPTVQVLRTFFKRDKESEDGIEEGMLNIQNNKETLLTKETY
jgi:peptidoglycan/LPS O-acetylase OafA/YrhL